MHIYCNINIVTYFEHACSLARSFHSCYPAFRLPRRPQHTPNCCLAAGDCISKRAKTRVLTTHETISHTAIVDMTTKTEIQALLRFLSQDAKIPLPTAMGKIKELQNASLTR